MFNGPLTQAELVDAKETLERVGEWEEKRRALLLRAHEQRFTLKNSLNMQNMIAVHLTNYFPNNGVITTTASHKIDFNGKKVRFPRHSIHFSLNSPVSGHMYGNWDGAKFAILIPLNKIAHRIVTLNPVDTWVIGELKLPQGSFIIGSANALKGKFISGVKLISVEGDLHQAVKDFIAQKGLPVSNIGMWAWSFDAENFELATRLITGGLNPMNSYDGGDFEKLAGSLGYTLGPHTSSIFKEIEDIFNSVMRYILFDDKFDIDERTCEAMENRIDEYYIIKLNEFLKKRDKFGLSTPERVAIEHIEKTLKHCKEELKLLKHRAIRKTFMAVGDIESTEDLGETEKEWLMREQSMIKKLEGIIAAHDEKKAEKILRKLTTIERRTYQKYKKFKSRLDELSKNTKFPVDISDIMKEIEIGEAFLARAFSVISLDKNDSIQSFIRNDEWDKAKEMIQSLEHWTIQLEILITDLHSLLEARKKKFEEGY